MDQKVFVTMRPEGRLDGALRSRATEALARAHPCLIVSFIIIMMISIVIS